jgi:uncharacterized SAM-binding protein YcdF (DUF218 family)
LLRSAAKWLLRSVLLLLLLLTPIVLTASYWLPAIGNWLSYPADPVVQTEAIAVYGGYFERANYGVELYHQGVAPEIWHTGYPKFDQRVTQRMLDQGVAANDFRWLDSRSTWEDGAAIATAIEENNIESVLLVTEWWHSRRALCATHLHLGAQDVAVWYTASPTRRNYTPENWWQSRSGIKLIASELGKFGFYWLRYGMNPLNC